VRISLKQKTLKKKWKRFKQSTFFVKLGSWEYWPLYITNIPVVGFWLFFAIRSRALFFFSAVNPAIETGGVLGESKINILNRLPKSTIPKTIFIKKETGNFDWILKQMKSEGIIFPIIAKPDVGERGFLVEKIKNEKALESYLEKVKVDFIIQDFIGFREEISLMYHRMPNAGNGKITSICIKKNLAVKGDGVSTIAELMQEYPRARLQLPRFKRDNPNLLKTIPENDETIELEPIGNHSRGTTFLNGNHHIDDDLKAVFDGIGFGMEGIYYGRFDLKCESIDLLKAGKDFKILEFNGIASEPAHIYDPEYPVFRAYKDLYEHWKIIFEISKVQRAKGVESMNLKEAFDSLVNYFKYMRSAKA
jgi:hypothetical protein